MDSAAHEKFLEECNYLAGRGAQGLEALQKCICTAPNESWVKQIPLVASVMNGHVYSTLRYLVEEVQVETLNALVRGDAPLHVAVIWGRTQTVAYLLARGADPQLLNSRGNTAAEMARTRQRRLEEQLADHDKPWRSDGSCIGRQQISKLCDEGRTLVDLLDGVEDCGSYRRFFSRMHRAMPHVHCFSPELVQAELRYALASLRALVTSGRATLKPIAERRNMEVDAAQRSAEKVDSMHADVPLQVHLTELSLASFVQPLLEEYGEEACKSIRSLSEVVESRQCLREVLGSETASRRLWKVILEFREEARSESLRQVRKKGMQSAAQMGAVTGYGDEPRRHISGYQCGVELLFHLDLPQGAFMVATFFLLGAPGQ
mmetsp:Transcript_44920/g.82012  ORF Transcript_44920/g.82012 Transcript_44920/m.82012 type:complete len:375 (-) Transcript_44920:90-1214(-)